MIFDTVEHITLYKGISSALDRAIDAIAGADFSALDAGRYEVDGDTVYYMVQTPALKAAEDTKWEAHRRYIDIQLALEGGEGIGYAPLGAIGGWQDYNAEKDMQLSTVPGLGTLLPLNAGHFAIFFPQDAHRPVVRIGASAEGRKVVFKVLV